MAYQEIFGGQAQQCYLVGVYSILGPKTKNCLVDGTLKSMFWPIFKLKTYF